MWRAFLILLGSACPALAEAGSARFDAQRFEVEQGIFCEVRTTGSTPAPGTVAGHIELFEEVPEFQWTGHRVPAVPGLSFGVKTRATDGLVYGDVIVELTHPAFRASGARRQTYITLLGGAAPSINAYTFDTTEELVTGTWTFTAIAGDDVLYSASFEVVPPSAAPDIASACGGVPVS